MGLTIDRATYYNLRQRSLSDSNDAFQGIVCCLEDEGFIFRIRFEEAVTPEGVVIPNTRQCQQIWFALPRQIEYARRFCPGFAILLDGTFKTNNLDLVLIGVNGITNTGTTFPVCFSFVRSEAKISMDFVLKCLKELIFGIAVGGSEGLRPSVLYGKPKVTLSDQAPGIISSVSSSLLDTKLQFCDWHAVKNIRKRVLEKKYTREERDLIREATWIWIKAGTGKHLYLDPQTAKEHLFSLLGQGKKHCQNSIKE